MSEKELRVIPAEEITRRFDRIESKLDVLSDAMVTLARNEEKVIAIQEQLSQHSIRLNRHSEKLDVLTKIVSDNAFTSKIVWFILTAVVGSIISMFFGVV